MALTASRHVSSYPDQQIRQFEVEANVKIFKHSFLSFVAGGYARPLVAAQQFAGIAYEEVDNTGGAAGAKKVRAYTQGDFEHACTATIANMGDAVYASDDGTLTLTAASNTYVGVVVGVPSTNVIIVRLDFGRTGP